MNKTLKSLLLAALTISAAQVKAHTNKTFLMPRPAGVNLPMEYTTFHALVNRQSEDKFGGNLQATGFYNGSTSNGKLSDYFMFARQANSGSTGRNRNLTYGDHANPFDPAVSGDLDLGYLIHNRQSTAGGGFEGQSVNVSMSPEHNEAGVRFDYFQELDRLLCGLYLYANLPVVHVENKLKLSVTKFDNATTDQTVTNVVNFFKGTFSQDQAANGGGNAQAALSNLKIDGSDSETGVADIEIGLGYKFLRRDCYWGSLALAITIPTGNDADSKKLFEAIVGNGGHFGLGGDLCLGARAWGDMDHNIKFMLKLKYRYLFEDSEKRTLGIKGTTGALSGNLRSWGHYQLLVPAGVAAAAATTLVPAANVTTLNVDVTPGSQLDFVLAMNYNRCGFCFDLGYDLYYREKESVKLKGNSGFTDGSYAVANLAINTANIGVAPIPTPIVAGLNGLTDGGAAAGTSAIINRNNLSTSAAETPSQTTHSVFGALGYVFKDWDYPMMLGLGGKYEFASSNSAVEQWGIWGKIGVGF